MGVYLSSPITDKESFDGQSERFVYGASSMQGWRITQEDAHNCIPVFDEKSNTSFFGVYDGHGGSEVAKYCERNFPDFVKNLMKIHGGAGDDPTLFIKNAFLAFDATLTNEDVIKELKQLAGKNENGKHEDGYHGKKTDTDSHKEKSRTSLDRLLAQYKNSSRSKNLPIKVTSQSSAATRLKSESTSDADSPSQHEENELPSSVSSSLSSPSPSKQDSCSGVLNGVLEADSSSVTVGSQSQDPVNIANSVNEGSLNNNNVDKVVSQPTHDGISSTGTDEVLLPLNKSKTNFKSAKDECQGNTGNKNSELSNTSLPSCLPDEAGREVTSTLNSVDLSLDKAASSNAEDTSNKTKAAGKTDLLDGDTDSSDDEDEEEEEDDDDMWEDMSDEEAYPHEINRPNPLMNTPLMDPCNEEVYKDLTVISPGCDSGCTACVVLMQDRKLIVANAGDSRCVLSRAGKAVELSFDHKPEDEIEKKRIEKAGGKVTLDGRVNGGLNLSRAIGDHVYKRNKELPAKEQMITALPDIETAELCDEDQFIVIACDGIWNYMTSQEVVDYVLEKLKDPGNRQKPSQICEKLFDHCLAPNTFGDGTGCDNMTCIIILLDTFTKSEPQDPATESVDTKDVKYKSEDDSSQHLLPPNLNDKDNMGTGSLKRCADSVDVPEGKRIKVEEEVA